MFNKIFKKKKITKFVASIRNEVLLLNAIDTTSLQSDIERQVESLDNEKATIQIFEEGESIRYQSYQNNGGGWISSSGIGYIFVTGMLVNDAHHYLTSYDDISNSVSAMVADDNVKSIIGVFSSGGGVANGAFEASDIIYKLRGKKSMTAFVKGDANSGAYAIASAFDSITASRLSSTGSIGAIVSVYDDSAYLKKAGIEKLTYTSDILKAPEVGSDAFNDKMQTMVNTVSKLFIETVSRNRRMPIDGLENTHGASFDSEASLSLGLIDNIGTIETIKSGEIMNDSQFKEIKTLVGDISTRLEGLENQTATTATATATTTTVTPEPEPTATTTVTPEPTVTLEPTVTSEVEKVEMLEALVKAGFATESVAMIAEFKTMDTLQVELNRRVKIKGFHTICEVSGVGSELSEVLCVDSMTTERLTKIIGNLTATDHITISSGAPAREAPDASGGWDSVKAEKRKANGQ